MRRPRTYLLLLAALLPACADHTDPMATPGGPRSSSVTQQNVLNYWQSGDTDWSDAFQRAADSGFHVYVPGGRTYRVTKPVYVRHPVTVYGDGSGSLIQQDTTVVGHNFNVFVVQAAGASVATLGFEGMGRNSSTLGFAVEVRHVGSVTVDNINVTRMGMVFTDHAAEPTVIKNSIGDGLSSFPWDSTRGVEHAIQLTNSRGVEVYNNTVSRYHNGIEWWGVWNNPVTGIRHYGLTSNHKIWQNRVYNTTAAIWGAGGENIRVEGNTAEICHDVCFDAEASSNVRFVRNTGRYAGTAVLATFYRADSIFFENNRVEQSNTLCSVGGAPCWPNHPFRANNDPRLGQRMFSLFDGNDTTYQSVHVFLRGNHFTHKDGVGFVDKTASTTFSMDGDTLVNSVVYLESGKNGTISLRNLRVMISQPTGYAGIKVASHQFAPMAGTATLVEGNRVERTNTTSSGTPGIDVYLRSTHPLSSVISGNVVVGYNSLAVAAHSDDAAHSFTITTNGLTGPIAVWGNPQPYSTQSGNYTYTPTSGTGPVIPPCDGSTQVQC